MKKLILILIFISISQYSYSGNVTGKISQISSHLDDWGNTNLEQQGILFLTIEGLENACASSYKRIAIPTDHPLYSTALSIALSAQAQSKNISIGYLSTCTYRTNAWDFSSITYNSN